MSRLTLAQGNNRVTVEISAGETLLETIRRNEFSMQAPCGGNGTCGKCNVVLTDSRGTRTVLACKTIPTEDGTVRIPVTAAEIPETAGDNHKEKMAAEGYLAAVDLGTTTVAVKVFDAKNDSLLGQMTVWNAQTAYGADVISRIKYTMESPGGLETLGRAIRKQIADCLRDLTGDLEAETKCRRMVIAGNTIMQHIFAGIDPSPIATAPFVPKTLFTDAPKGTWECFPCVSGYVGGDILAGLYANELDKKQENFLFLDIGTNGEMVIHGPKGLLTCSVATGPAFEGAEISCGMIAAAGAVRHVTGQNGKLRLDVAGGGEAVGICGSGLIDLLALLVREEIVDETGRLLPPEETPNTWAAYLGEDEDENGVFYLNESRTVCLTARDVRKLQLAKAAVAAGIVILLRESGLAASDLESVYLAGTFGAHMDVESAAAIGLLPKELAGKVKMVGNASLDGAERLLFHPEERDRLRQLQRDCHYLELSTWPDFNELYVDAMYF